MLYLCHFADRDEVGGAQKLVVNVAISLQKQGKKVCVIDKENGYTSSKLIDEGYDFIIKYVSSCRVEALNEIEFEPNDVLVCFNRYIIDFTLVDLSKNPRLFFWDLYYVRWLNLFTFFNKRVLFLSDYYKRRLINLLNTKNALAVMDPPGKDYLQKFTDKLIPSIFIPSKEIKVNGQVHIGDKFCYIGRAEIWKIQPAVKIFKDLASIYGKGKFSLTIITDDRARFLDGFKSLLKADNFDYLESLNVIDGVKNDQYLDIASKHKISFGMGTTIIDLTLAKIPSLIIDSSSNTFPRDYKYRTLAEANMPGLAGEDLSKTKLPIYKHKGDMLKDKLEKFELNCHKIVDENYRYSKRYHEIDAVSMDLYHKASKSKLSYKDYIYFVKKIPCFVSYNKVRVFLYEVLKR